VEETTSLLLELSDSLLVGLSFGGSGVRRGRRGFCEFCRRSVSQA